LDIFFVEIKVLFDRSMFVLFKPDEFGLLMVIDELFVVIVEMIVVGG